MCTWLAECCYFAKFNPTAEHGKANDWGNVCSPMTLFSRGYALYDVVGDFLFWASLLSEDAVSESVKTSILAFAIIGAVLDCLHGCGLCLNACVNSLNRSGADLADARRGKIITDRLFSVIITLLENIPQLVLSGIATHQLGKTTPMFFVTVSGSILSTVGNLGWTFYQICVLDRIASQAKAHKVMFMDPCCGRITAYCYEDMCSSQSTAMQMHYQEQTKGWVGVKKVSLLWPRAAIDKPNLDEAELDEIQGLASA